jgi:DNA-directed RNA polymerase specialized sigma24 family protein
MKRLITEHQEQILRLCHHDFEGLTPEQAAEKLCVSPSAITRVLARIEEIMPDYFPILTKLEAKTYHHYMIEGWDVSEIAEYLNQSENAVYKTLQRARDKGMFFSDVKGKALSYTPEMDANVKQKF